MGTTSLTAQREYYDQKRLTHRSAGILGTAAALLLAASGAVLAEEAPKPLYPAYPSETPDKFTPVTDSYDFRFARRHDSMRDGVKLHTIILVPKGAAHAGMLLDPHSLWRHGTDQPRA